MAVALQWERDGVGWPHREASRFVQAGGLRWHVQQMGRGPALLLLHGTGAASHSWRDLMPLLAPRFTVIAPDLPGHGFTDMPPSAAGMSLPGMAQAFTRLLQALDARPVLLVGHSAGAAIAARLCLDGAVRPSALVGVNGALLPLRGWPAMMFSPLARLMASNPLVPALFARHAEHPASVRRLIASTGSTLDERGTALYGLLVRNASHAGAALRMMAHWDLEPLARELPQLAVPLTLVVGGRDRTLPPSEGARAQAMLPAARLVTLPDLGHLAHEEAPQDLAEIIGAAWRDASGRSAGRSARTGLAPYGR